MIDTDLSFKLNLVEKIFAIIKEEYKVFLTKEKEDFIDNLDYVKFLKYKEDVKFPFLTIGEDSYYLNNKNPDIEVVVFMCLSILCGNLNPLKIELILLEVKYLIEKYNLSSSGKTYDKLELAEIVQEGLLKDVPFKIIFLDSDIEIFNYLVSEKGYKVARLYMEISLLMQKKVQEQLKKFNPFQYLEVASQFDYEEIYDQLYNFINMRII